MMWLIVMRWRHCWRVWIALSAKGVFHAAGVLDDAVITGLTPDRVDTLLQAVPIRAVCTKLTEDMDLSARLWWCFRRGRDCGHTRLRGNYARRMRFWTVAIGARVGWPDCRWQGLWGGPRRGTSAKRDRLQDGVEAGLAHANS